MNTIGTHGFGDQGPLNDAFGNLIQQGGFEPDEIRALRRVTHAATDEQGRRYVEVDQGTTTNDLTWSSGMFSGEPMRVYRLVDDAGKPLPFVKNRQGDEEIDTTDAESIINNVMKGDLMKVDINSPQVDFKLPLSEREKKREKRDFAETQVPQVGAYAKKDGDRWTVLVVNRSLDQTAEVQVQLPVKQASKVTKHWLTGDAKDTNRDALNVKWEQSELPANALASGKLTIELEPSGFHCYEFHGK